MTTRRLVPVLLVVLAAAGCADRPSATALAPATPSASAAPACLEDRSGSTVAVLQGVTLNGRPAAVHGMNAVTLPDGTTVPSRLSTFPDGTAELVLPANLDASAVLLDAVALSESVDVSVDAPTLEGLKDRRSTALPRITIVDATAVEGGATVTIAIERPYASLDHASLTVGGTDWPLTSVSGAEVPQGGGFTFTFQGQGGSGPARFAISSVITYVPSVRLELRRC